MTQQVGVDPVLFIGDSGSGRLIDRPKSHLSHQSSDALSAYTVALTPKGSGHLSGAVLGVKR
jgi:hypothetical protein